VILANLLGMENQKSIKPVVKIVKQVLFKTKQDRLVVPFVRREHMLLRQLKVPVFHAQLAKLFQTEIINKV
jgi:hypothetical protein